MRAFRAELFDSARSVPRWLVAAVIVALPTAYGLTIRDQYALVDAQDLFTLMLGDVMPLTFPLWVSLLYQPRLLDEWANSFTRGVRTRMPMRTYLASRAAVAATWAAGVFSTMVVLAWVAAFAVFGSSGMVQASPVPVAERFTFSQLYAVSPVVFITVYAAWVGLNAAAYGVLSTAASALIGNRFIALVTPIAFYLVAGFALAVLRLEHIGTATSIFPFSIVQQPIGYALVPLLGVLVLAAAAFVVAGRQQYFTAGLERV